MRRLARINPGREMKKVTRYLLLWLLSMGVIYTTIFLLATAG